MAAGNGKWASGFCLLQHVRCFPHNDALNDQLVYARGGRLDLIGPVFSPDYVEPVIAFRGKPACLMADTANLIHTRLSAIPLKQS